MSWTVRFFPEAGEWHAARPVPLSLAAAACDILLDQPCTRGTCGRCRVRVDAGAAAPGAMDLAALGVDAVAAGWRLGCQLVLTGHAHIYVPPQSRVVAHKSFGAAAIDVPAGRTGYGVALDLGSTTLAAAVVALADGRVLATAAALNPQVTFGADIMSRIAFALQQPHGARALRTALAAGVNGLLRTVLADAALDPDEVVELCVVGNPTMTHTLLGLSIAELGEAPFQGTHYDSWSGRAHALDLELRHAQAYVAPGVAAHVGADTVAGLLACGLDAGTDVRLFLDLGTNTEVALAGPFGILCTSAAAAPAFEGAAIHHGMRAVAGAIDQVRVTTDGALLSRTIDDVPPVGMCGSGLLDAVAELLRTGLIEPSGRLRPASELDPAHPLRAHLLERPDGRAVTIADGVRPVLLLARDVRELQLVKASIAAAVELLAAEAGIVLGDVSEVLLAGAFGSYVCGRTAGALGLLPALPAGRVRSVGNAAGAGARLLLADPRRREHADRLARRARYVELAGRPEYQDALIDGLAFPVPA